MLLCEIYGDLNDFGGGWYKPSSSKTVPAETGFGHSVTAFLNADDLGVSKVPPFAAPWQAYNNDADKEWDMLYDVAMSYDSPDSEAYNVLWDRGWIKYIYDDGMVGVVGHSSVIKKARSFIFKLAKQVQAYSIEVEHKEGRNGTWRREEWRIPAQRTQAISWFNSNES